MVFEIGSITKAFTALLLADMAGRGEVGLDDPAARHLPDGVAMPERGGRQIALVDLATHTSGLPRRPGNLAPAHWENLYAGYTAEQLYACLGACQLRTDIGAAHLYSNLGMGLLGHALALRAGVDFETLVRERITEPLGMASTAVELSADPAARFATGHDQRLGPVGEFQMGVLAGAGALRSTASDLLDLLAAMLGLASNPLAAALAAQLAVRRPSDKASDIQALGWRIRPHGAGEIVFHNGATRGHRCFLQFDLGRRAGVVVLTNCASARNDDLGLHLLGGLPLQPPPRPADASELDRLMGRYRLGVASSLEVSRADDRLFAQLSGQDAYEVYPVGPGEVRWASAEATATFAFGADGRGASVVLRQNGRERRAARAD
jgi:CubicO group peptidase (beta-lactamase class C family)